MYGFMLSALSSNSGKTVLSSGIVRALSERAPIVPFKCGPDYVDPLLLSHAARTPAYNLDSVLSGDDGLREIFSRSGDRAIVEGVMGFFDGLDPVTFEGSSYHIAKILQLPVVLILNAQGMAATVAAQVLGVQSVAKDVKIAGVILNRVSSVRHEEILKSAVKAHTDIDILGAVPTLDDLAVPSRKTGLITPDEAFFEYAGGVVKRYVDIDRLSALSIDNFWIADQVRNDVDSPVVYIAYDEAFCFYYQSTFDLLEANGYTIKRFSPLRNETVEGADLIYLGGGYPELHLDRLSKATQTKESILAHYRAGRKVFGEGGGFLYMTRSIDSYPTLGIFEADSVSSSRRRLGYVQTTLGKGHIYSYAELINVNESYFGEATRLSSGEVYKDGFMKNAAYGGFSSFMFNRCIDEIW
ncbi:MAG: cobyrinate a,c-diamide synthase [Deferribacteraceae bacterium]|jgi:cobyrinic acid a,c-diamide synthase|nr:cobyrinate a,c-diamide synthase [Deferribacteraceae bacterium]